MKELIEQTMIKYVEQETEPWMNACIYKSEFNKFANILESEIDKKYVEKGKVKRLRNSICKYGNPNNYPLCEILKKLDNLLGKAE